MQSLTKPFTGPSKPQNSGSVNPFARALAETEKQPGSSPTGMGDTSFSDALARTGGKFADPDNFKSFNDPYDTAAMERQRAEAEAQRKKEMQRRELHKKVNPVDTTELFNAREKKIKEEIDKVRQELRMLAKDVAKFDKEVEITLMTEVADPGEQGKYYISFFQKLRAFIMLLRQKIQSARTWATQMHSKNTKKKKKQSKAGVGMMIQGLSHEKTATVQNMQHHERSSMYSGG